MNFITADMKSPYFTDRQERLAQLQKTERFSRGEALAKAGFAIMPGDKAPVPGVAEACANRLVPESN